VFVANRAAVGHMTEGGRVITTGSCNAERMPFGSAIHRPGWVVRCDLMVSAEAAAALRLADDDATLLGFPLIVLVWASRSAIKVAVS
jgi:hypothetical protein